MILDNATKQTLFKPPWPISIAGGLAPDRRPLWSALPPAASIDIPFAIAELDGVIFGARMSDTDRLALANMLRSFYPGVELYQAKPKPDEYGLAIEVAAENTLVVPPRPKYCCRRGCFRNA